MSSDLDTARELRAAAGYLREHGWIQYQGGQDGGPRCLGGALLTAIGSGAWDCAALNDDAAAMGFDAPCSDCIGTSPSDALVHWNDMEDRTLDEVLDRLESTALALEVRHLAANQPAEKIATTHETPHESELAAR
jgi:hypothetical protein